ncbi:MAG: hypothetical protein KDN18_00100 [Verrucomicrobiae bacterium]|nr:hypothetical protein [Verrucomicrobiae bacterium]
MDVFLSEIPEEGLHLEGEFPPAIFELATEDPIRPAGPVHYEATIFAFEEVITVHGRLSGPFELQCGACLEYFPYEADFPHWSSELDREPDQESFDLETLVREDFLLNLPSHPRCDEYVEGRVCPKADLVEEFSDEADAPDPDSPRPNVWGALDEWKQ